MTPYLDSGFLLTLLVKTRGSRVANQLLRRIPGPVPLNFLHQLQAENLLVALQRSAEPARQYAGAEGQRFWKNYLAEGVFQLAPDDWDTAFRLASTWNSQCPDAPPPPLLLLHPALALAAGATHFLGFDPRSRDVARAHGFNLLPERI